MELRMKSATLALVALTTSSLACIERAAPCVRIPAIVNTQIGRS